MDEIEQWIPFLLNYGRWDDGSDFPMIRYRIFDLSEIAECRGSKASMENLIQGNQDEIRSAGKIRTTIPTSSG